jgi:predicted phosphodiesterase
MSRRAIISDIHSNLLALEAVLADIQQQNVDGVICLGDICGYGPQPIECVEKVRSVAQWTLMGNHDEALFVEPKDFGKNARLAIEWQKRVLEPKLDSTQVDEERWYWLQNLSPRRV